MNCKDYGDLSYMNIAAADIIKKLEEQNFLISSACLHNLVEILKIHFKDVTDKQKLSQMNQKLEHMMQVVEDSLCYVNNEKHYSHNHKAMTDDQKQIYVLSAILHDTGRIFEIASLGTSGSQINFNHSALGREFLEGSIGTQLFDNLKKELPVEKVDEFLISNLQEYMESVQKDNEEPITEETIKRVSRLSLLCLPYSMKKLKTGNELTVKEITLYCVGHHGDMDIPKDCPESINPFLESNRISDRIANLRQGMSISPELITGGKTAEEIATAYQPVDLGENGEPIKDACVIDEVTYKELTTGATSKDNSTYFGVDRGRNIDEQGEKLTYTPMRMFLSRVGWIYAEDNDLNFYKFCKESKCIDLYCENIKPFLREQDLKRLQEIQECAKQYIDKKINTLLKENKEIVDR